MLVSLSVCVDNEYCDASLIPAASTISRHRLSDSLLIVNLIASARFATEGSESIALRPGLETIVNSGSTITIGRPACAASWRTRPCVSVVDGNTKMSALRYCFHRSFPLNIPTSRTSATRLLATVSRPSLKRFDTMFSVSKAAEEFAKRTYGIKTEILPNVVETSRFSSAEKFVEFADKPTIVFLGRLVPRKGCQILLEAVRDIVNNGARIPFRVLICGRGPLEQSLKSFVSSHRLETYVQFTGYVSEDDKPRYFASADLAVFPSTGGESFGIVLLEAMAAGHAVVLGADNPGYHSVLAPSPDSLCKVADAEDLAKKIQTLLEDSDARQRILKWQSSHIRQFDVAVVGVQLG